jgi:hypothetical protein
MRATWQAPRPALTVAAPPLPLSLPCPAAQFTFGFASDWCLVDGVWRVSGEDHFSAFKPPRASARYQALIDWSVARHPRSAARRARACTAVRV